MPDSQLSLHISGTMINNLLANADTQDTQEWDSILGWGRSPQERNDNPLQYSCLGNLMGRGAWQATCTPWS